ncbi:hypothetical protein CkaCkLH20_07274 [Colletotrichum karsti]|uniref:Uncharacterized protein n=1 Tax=Colletotrichum karsti TaxID=1095194 RepID=A0A9P6I3N8_9PEZI|nr:uncharacterized protein CkaCkLH20_07274 [Colletotrichum karsti]KAF9875454.1 hypothetical protein CkaCkLH20_07274 [Colletotrichum karsti]
MAKILHLPPEIIDQLCTHIRPMTPTRILFASDTSNPGAQMSWNALYSLSMTCRYLRAAIADSGLLYRSIRMLRSPDRLIPLLKLIKNKPAVGAAIHQIWMVVDDDGNPPCVELCFSEAAMLRKMSRTYNINVFNNLRDLGSNIYYRGSAGPLLSLLLAHTPRVRDIGFLICSTFEGDRTSSDQRPELSHLKSLSLSSEYSLEDAGAKTLGVLLKSGFVENLYLESMFIKTSKIMLPSWFKNTSSLTMDGINLKPSKLRSILGGCAPLHTFRYTRQKDDESLILDPPTLVSMLSESHGKTLRTLCINDRQEWLYNYRARVGSLKAFVNVESLWLDTTIIDGVDRLQRETVSEHRAVQRQVLEALPRSLKRMFLANGAFGRGPMKCVSVSSELSETKKMVSGLGEVWWGEQFVAGRIGEEIAPEKDKAAYKAYLTASEWE